MKKKFALGIIPARGGSKGIKKKNIVKLNGKPLIYYTINVAKKSKYLDDFILTSDDKKIRNIAKKYSSKVIDRPNKYSHDKILQEVDLLLKWTTKKYEVKYKKKVDIVVLLYPTSPLRDVKSLDKAIDMVKNKNYDSVLSLYFDTRYLWEIKNKTAKPINYDPNKRMPRQREHWNQWAENKSIYVMKKEVLFKKGRIGKKNGFVEMEKWRSIDVDTKDDLLMAKSLIKKL